VSGNDANNGTSESTPWKTFDKAIQSAGTNTRILFKRGETFSTGGRSINVAGPGVIGAYGSGAKPIIQVSGTEGGIVLFKSDWRIMDLEFVGPGSSDQQGAIVFDAAHGINNILLLRLTSRQFRVGII
jgi:hypothetical protein